MSKVLPLPGTLRVQLTLRAYITVCLYACHISSVAHKAPCLPPEVKAQASCGSSRKSRGKQEEKSVLTLRLYLCEAYGSFSLYFNFKPKQRGRPRDGPSDCPSAVWGGTHSQLVASAWLSLAGRLGRGAKLEANRSSTTEAACSESGQHLSLGRGDLCHPGGRALGHDLDGLLCVDAVRTAWLDVGCTRSN